MAVIEEIAPRSFRPEVRIGVASAVTEHRNCPPGVAGIAGSTTRPIAAGLRIVIVQQLIDLAEPPVATPSPTARQVPASN